jgi:hypothetical protein
MMPGRASQSAGTRGMSHHKICSSGFEPDNCCRFFLCARCRTQTLVCSRCDRGQIYCSRYCSAEVRRSRQREARARYQASPRGRQMHVERSRRYRARRRVTDQGLRSPGKPASQDMPTNAAAVADRRSAATKYLAAVICSCCGNHFSSFVRLEPIRQRWRRSARPRASTSTCRR